MLATTAKSIGKYLNVVDRIRQQWKVQHLELWFRAEDLRHYDTRLQPGLYRPKEDGKRKPVSTLLEIDNDLYVEFDRCATQLSMADADAVDDEWDSYFLMQHHGVPTRLLGCSDGSLIALHFAVDKKKRIPESGSVVYVLDPYWLNRLIYKHPDRKDAIKRWKRYCQGHGVRRFPLDHLQEGQRARVSLMRSIVVPAMRLLDLPNRPQNACAAQILWMVSSPCSLVLTHPQRTWTP